MSTFSLDLPVDVPWKIIAASPDMMDTTVCNKKFPFAWRSSLAISVFEPKIEDLPDRLCDQRLTLMKITCSITGYQPSKTETTQGYVEFSDVPADVLDSLLAEYYGCYGVLLNAAVFPSDPTLPAGDATRTTIDFSGHKPGERLDNPYQDGACSFEAVAQASITTVQRAPAGQGGRVTEIDIANQLAITTPPCDRVEARVATFAAPITLNAYRGTSLVGTAVTTAAAGHVSTLAVTGAHIDKVVLTAPQNEGSLISFTYVARAQREVTLADYPHIIDFEPKMRDLYQAATDSGEVLTASNSQTATGKTLTHTTSSETGLNVSGTFGQKMGDATSSITAGLTSKWGSTDQDKTQINVDSSRERREVQGTTTNLSQLFNLLTGYHAGTNRGSFLMLPRPHTLQSTDRRTFAQGLRIIEGVQEFLLIVTRPLEMPGLCVEAYLETGHFPENVTINQPPPQYEHDHEDFVVNVHANNGTFSGDTVAIETDSSATHHVATGFVIDRTQGDPGHGGISDTADNSNNQARDSLRSYNYQATDDSTVVVSGTVQGAGAFGAGAIFNHTYRVFTRSQNPIPSDAGRIVTTPVFVTSRGLCVCFHSGNDGCVTDTRVKDPSADEDGHLPNGNDEAQVDTTDGSIVYESLLKFDAAVFSADALQSSRLPAMKEVLNKMQRVMTVSWRQPSRRPFGAVRFLDSDYFLSRVQAALPAAVLEMRVGDLEGAPEDIVAAFGAQRQISEIGKLSIGRMAAEMNVSPSEAARARREMVAAATRTARQPG
jgi:hypothetical protein